MSKDDELVWVFPTCVSKGFQDLPGVSTNMVDWHYFVEEVLSVCRFMRRGDVEDGPTMLQVIPYTVLKFEDKVLIYNRGVKGGEQRLANKYSIGVGGHINTEDCLDPRGSTDSLLTLWRGARREMREELTGVDCSHENLDLSFRGFIQVTNTSVEAVHFGVVLEAEFTASICIKESEEINNLEWVDIDRLGEYNLENWSRLVAINILKGDKK